MHTTGSLSLSFPLTNLAPHTTVIRLRLTCEVRITDSDNYYEMKNHLCTDGSRIVMGISYDLPYAPVIDGDVLLLMITIATSN